MSTSPDYPPLVRAILKALDAFEKGATTVEKKLGTMAHKRAENATKPEKVARIEKKVAQSAQRREKAAAAVRKLRHIFLPDSSQIDPQQASWAQTKSIISFLGAAVIGGATGIFLYATPFLFPVLMLTSLPLLGLGVGVRGLGLLLPKGGDLRQSMTRIGNRLLGTGTLIALAPMALAGVPAFLAIHAALTLTGNAVAGAKAGIRTRKTAAPEQAVTTGKAKNWTASLGNVFNKLPGRRKAATLETTVVAAPVAEEAVAAPAPQETPDTATTETAAPAAPKVRKPRAKTKPAASKQDPRG